jgi:endonuclease-8
VPEGDTIHRLADKLRGALEGQRITSVKTAVAEVRERHLEGATVIAVTARGKNLLIGLSNGLTLHTHMMMNGVWHVYRRGERWRAPSFRLRIALETETVEAVCFGAPVVRLLRTDRLEADPRLGKLGPDLADADFDAAEAARRVASLPDRSIAEALLDQRSVAGIGNVLKSEVLFLAKVHPMTRAGSVEADVLAHILTIARELMEKNVAVGKSGRHLVPGRVTRFTSRSLLGRGGELWVYERRGEKCLVCATPIEMARQGEDNRSTYWCPQCQPAPAQS